MLKVGIIGCGFMGRMHANVYGTLPNAHLVGCFDHSPQKSAEFGEQFQIQSFESFEQLAQACDAIDICLPTHLHAEATIRAANLKKHVICEKPMALSTEEARQMITACEENDVRLMIAHCIRFWPEYAYLKQIQLTDQLGALESLNLTRYGEFPHWSSNNWLADESLTGGAALDMHIHDTDFAMFMLGKPKEVYSAGTVDARGLSHIFSTFLYDDAVIHLEGGWNLPSKTPFKMSFRAIFEQGAVIWDNGPLTVYEPNKEPFLPEFPKMSAQGGGNISDLGGYYHELAHFVDRVLTGKPFDVTTPESSLESLELALGEIAQAKQRAGGV